MTMSGQSSEKEVKDQLIKFICYLWRLRRQSSFYFTQNRIMAQKSEMQNQQNLHMNDL